VTNFSPKTYFQGAQENLHLVERWTRLDANTIEYAVTIEDPTTWTRPWTVKQEYSRQSDEANRIYKEPRCHEGNYGMVALLAGARDQERAFAEKRGPDPATECTAGCGGFAFGFSDSGEDANPWRDKERSSCDALTKGRFVTVAIVSAALGRAALFIGDTNIRPGVAARPHSRRQAELQRHLAGVERSQLGSAGARGAGRSSDAARRLFVRLRACAGGTRAGARRRGRRSGLDRRRAR
jgi:hypothetical protein